MTNPDETESVQTDGLAEGHRVEFEIKEPQRGSKGRQAINVKLGNCDFWLHQFRAEQKMRNLTTAEGGVDVAAETSADVVLQPL